MPLGSARRSDFQLPFTHHRYAAARDSRRQGSPRITAPITLVQDVERTPRFLFYFPFNLREDGKTLKETGHDFSGLVYAPFVVQKLMDGTLDSENRHVRIRISDRAETLYDELEEEHPDADPDPLFQRRVELPLYGRDWTFELWTTQSFRTAAADAQPLTILISGTFIDLLLLGFFIALSRSSRRALQYADLATQQLRDQAARLQASEDQVQRRASQLASSNAELEQFAYVASHDLQEPLRKIASYCEIIKEDYGEELGSEGRGHLDIAIDGADRLQQLVQDLLRFSRITSRGKPAEVVDATHCCREAIDQLELAIAETDATVIVGDLPLVVADRVQLTQLYQNLIGNALKYRGADPPVVRVEAATHVNGSRKSERLAEPSGI